MVFEIHYFHERVYAEVQSWPVDVLADYARLVELLTEPGQAFACHIHAPLVTVCLNCVRAADRELVGRFIVFSWEREWTFCMRL